MRFVFVDRIVTLQPGVSIEAVHAVGHGEPYFDDHFPGFPVVPGVLLTEMMGQAAATCLTAHHEQRGKPMLAKIIDATFKQWVRPGTTLRLLATITSLQSRVAQASCEARVEAHTVAAAKLMFAFAPAESFIVNPRDDALQRFMAAGAV